VKSKLTEWRFTSAEKEKQKRSCNTAGKRANWLKW